MAGMETTLFCATIVLHGRLADLLGRRFEIHAPAQSSIAELRRRIAVEHPAASDAILGARIRACVGDAIVPDSYRPAPGETVEFLPPVSGG